MRRLQIVEPMQWAHHTNYLLAILPSAVSLRRTGVLDDVVVTITAQHLALLTDMGIVARNAGALTWDASLPFTSSWAPLRERIALHRAVRRSVDRHRPDGLLCTTADIDMVANVALRFVPSQDWWPRRSVGIVHFGYPKGGLSRREDAKRRVYELLWSASRWQHLAIVNPLVFESYHERRKTAGGRYGFVPDPVPPMDQIDRAEARAALGLPAEGVLIGCVGMMDRRRAIPELVRAFFRLDAGPDVKLVLAGRIDADFRRAIDAEHAEAIGSGRLLLVDRMLSDREVMCGFRALDLHSVLQYRRFNLSANVLKCMAAGRPYVCDRVGHGAWMANRFGAGIVCDVSDEASIVEALRIGLERVRASGASPARRFVDLHSLENFARTALASAIGDAADAALGPRLGWRHAYDGVAGC